MKSFKHIGLLFLLLATSSVFAQQGAILKPLEFDSIQMEINRLNDYRKLISGGLFTEQPILRIGFPANSPEFNFKQNNSFRLNFNDLNGFPLTSFSAGNTSTFYSPFLHDATILSQDAYSIGNKIVVGGFSYGGNSIFSAPFPNQNSTNFDSYGSTLFMQYKISKNFKIETRVNVTNRPGPGF